jgi:hypothetical protein
LVVNQKQRNVVEPHREANGIHGHFVNFILVKSGQNNSSDLVEKAESAGDLCFQPSTVAG